MNIVFSVSFKRSLRSFFRKHPELRETFENKAKLFAENPFHPSLKTHNLGGTLDGMRSFSITHDYRVIFEFMPDGSALFSHVGTHDEVY